MEFTEITVKHSGDVVQKFDGTKTINDVLEYLNNVYDKDSIKDVQLDIITKDKAKIKESIEEITPNREYVIWSSTDLAENNEQIPLITIKFDENGDVEDVIAPSEDEFDKESKKITVNSLKATEGRPMKDRLLRVDKSLNHSDPFFSVEKMRQDIISNKGIKKLDISDIVNDDYLNNMDKETKIKNEQAGLETLANQILITNRDDIKAAANNKSANEKTMTDMFTAITGVDYYTEEVVEPEQYEYLLSLLGRSGNKYDDSHQEPKDNGYVMGLKDLVEDLIEKILLRQDSKFYERDSGEIMAIRGEILNNINKEVISLSEDTNSTEDMIVSKFKELTGVDYYTNKIVDESKYNTFLDDMHLDFVQPIDNKYIKELENTVEDSIEVVLLRADPNFYN